MFSHLAVRRMVQYGQGGGTFKWTPSMSNRLLMCAARNPVGGKHVNFNAFSSTTHSCRSKRLGIKASRTASVPSIVHRKPFGVVTSITGDTTIPRKGKWSYTNFIQSFGSSSINFLQRKWKYQRIRAEKFRRWMTQRRIISLPYGYILPTNVSSITGHMSFIMLAFSFMESDVVLLRSYAIGAISASILFQYYRAQPLWIPISWNVIFLLINGAMITALIRERQEASHLEPAEAEVYSEVYDKVGTDPVEFLRVIRRAERCMVSKGTILAKAGDQQKKLYLIVNGQFKVYDPDGMSLGTIRSHQYIGSMAFLRFMYSSLAHDGHHKGGIRALVAAHHPTNHEDEKKNEAKTPTPPRLASDCLADAVVEAMESMEAEAGPLKGMVNDTNSTNPAETVDPNFEKECICRSTVISEKASDVYVWDFKDLADYFRDHPKEQNAMTVSIGADLTEKIDQSRDADINYYHFLNAALRFGEVLPLEKKKLQMFRKEHRISLSKHESMLNELGWTKNDFDEGVQNKEVSSNFTRYSNILSGALKNGVVLDEMKVKLREARKDLGIDAQEHLILLNKLGWTLDDYEAGEKYKSLTKNVTADLPGSPA